ARRVFEHSVSDQRLLPGLGRLFRRLLGLLGSLIRFLGSRLGLLGSLVGLLGTLVRFLGSLLGLDVFLFLLAPRSGLGGFDGLFSGRDRDQVPRRRRQVRLSELMLAVVLLPFPRLLDRVLSAFVQCR